MREIRTAAAVMLGFVAGCATAAVARGFVVPPAQAQNVRRWDYLCFEQDHAADVMAKAKQAGQEGWEMVTTGNGNQNLNDVWCFKRPF